MGLLSGRHRRLSGIALGTQRLQRDRNVDRIVPQSVSKDAPRSNRAHIIGRSKSYGRTAAVIQPPKSVTGRDAPSC